MARFLALDVDAREARVAAASTKAGQVYVEHAFVVDLTDVNSVDPTQSASQAAKPAGEISDAAAAKIAAALAARGLKRGELMAVVGRSSLELKQLTLPPAPDDELPEMVRFQALREFNSIEENWPLDFIPLDDDPSQPRNVLAAVLSPEPVARLRNWAQANHMTLTDLVLRPSAAATLWRRRSPPASPIQVRLLVDLMAAEVDLTAAVGDRSILMRTARLPGNVLTAPEEARPLISEIRRTIAAVQNQLGGAKVEELHLAGGGWGHVQLSERITAELDLPVKLFDPFTGLSTSPEVEAAGLEYPGRFAPLLGLLVEEAAGRPHDFNFLHPRRKPAPPNNRRRQLLLASAAGALVLMAGGSYWRTLSGLDEEISLQNQTAAVYAKQLVQYSPYIETAKVVDDWNLANVVWLDELSSLSRQAPASKEVMLTRLSVTASKDGARVSLQGVAENRESVSKLEKYLKADHRTVFSGGVQNSEQHPRYTQQFDAALEVKVQEVDAYRTAFSQPSASASASPSTAAPSTAAPAPVEAAAAASNPATSTAPIAPDAPVVPEAPVVEPPLTATPSSPPVTGSSSAAADEPRTVSTPRGDASTSSSDRPTGFGGPPGFGAPPAGGPPGFGRPPSGDSKGRPPFGGGGFGGGGFGGGPRGPGGPSGSGESGAGGSRFGRRPSSDR